MYVYTPSPPLLLFLPSSLLNIYIVDKKMGQVYVNCAISCNYASTQPTTVFSPSPSSFFSRSTLFNPPTSSPPSPSSYPHVYNQRELLEVKERHQQGLIDVWSREEQQWDLILARHKQQQDQFAQINEISNKKQEQEQREYQQEWEEQEGTGRQWRGVCQGPAIRSWTRYAYPPTLFNIIK